MTTFPSELKKRMGSDEIRIYIVGRHGVGKTAIARLIMGTLASMGIRVELHDDDEPEAIATGLSGRVRGLLEREVRVVVGSICASAEGKDPVRRAMER